MVQKGVIPPLIEVLSSNREKDNDRKRWAANIIALLALNDGTSSRFHALLLFFPSEILTISSNAQQNQSGTWLQKAKEYRHW